MENPVTVLIERFVKAYNSFDIEGMLSLLHPDIHFVNISEGKVDFETHGKAAFEKLARQSAALFKERKQEIIEWKKIEDILEVGIRFQAVLADDLPDGKKKGDIIDIKGKSEYIIKDNLIKLIRDIS